MTFKYKLSVRLALLKDALLLVSVTALACEKPAGVTGPGSGPSGPVVSRVALAPAQITLHPDQKSQFTAVGLTAAGDTIAVAVTWSATGGSIVDTSSKGSIHYATYQPSTAPGTYLVIATDPPETGVADTSSVIVIPVPVASVSLSPAVATVLLGATLQLTATPQDSSSAALSGRVVTWASSAPAVATVSATGLLTAVAAGSTTVTVTSEGKSATSTITVTPVPVTSVVVSPAAASVPAGATLQLGASAKDSSGGTLTGRVVTWSTSAASVATVSASGLVKGVAPGSATITASAEGKAGTSTITVTQVPVASVTVSPASASVSVGGSVQLTATPKDASGSALTGRVVTWSSSASTVASVTSSGLVTGVAAGSATITASSEGKSATSAITVSAVTGTHAGHYVAPGGSAGGDGTATKPWDLATALAQPASVVPGDTIWLRGGVYAGIFTSRLAGTPSAPIIVRQYPGERAIVSRNGASSVNTFSILGQYTWYWGFEVANTTTNAPFDRTGVDVNGPGVKLINLVVHDHSGNGIGAWIPAPDAEVYGCIVYNNGWHGSSDAPPSYGHGIYSQNQTGSKLFADNIVFNQFGAGIHAYGSDVAFLNNYDLEGNVSFNNGSPLGRGNPDILLGGHVGMNNIRVNNNMTYQTSGGTSVWLGWTSTQNNDLVAQNNYFAGQIQVVNWNSVVFRNNRLQHANKMELLVPTATVPVYDWDNNGYVLTHVNDVWGGPFGTTIAGVSTNYSSLAAFQTATGGLDAHSTLSQPSSGTPSGNLAFVRPNVYEPGRANIIIYNWDQAATVSVDVSSVLAVGTRFEVRNVQDFLGTPVLTGTYAGGSLQLPMAGLQPPRPIGVPLDPLVGSPVTGPEFNVFVLRTLP